MKTPQKCTCNCCDRECDCNRKELDFLSEECFNLARDIFDLDEDIEGLADWTKEASSQYNKALESIDYNFNVLVEEINELKARPISKEIEYIPESNTGRLWILL